VRCGGRSLRTAVTLWQKRSPTTRIFTPQGTIRSCWTAKTSTASWPPYRDFWHKQVVVDACNAGKDIYCEKPMSHTIPEGFEMVQAAESNKRIVQIGAHESVPSYARRLGEMYLAGTIGDVTSVELTLGRNSPTGAWEYPPPWIFLPKIWPGTPG